MAAKTRKLVAVCSLLAALVVLPFLVSRGDKNARHVFDGFLAAAYPLSSLCFVAWEVRQRRRGTSTLGRRVLYLGQKVWEPNSYAPSPERFLLSALFLYCLAPLLGSLSFALRLGGVWWVVPVGSAVGVIVLLLFNLRAELNE